jgi:pimeloyl-ACP methyl ester carboxylesterase
MARPDLRLHGTPPYRWVIVHGGPGAPGSVSSLARRLAVTMGVVEPFQTRATVWELVEELHEQIRTTAQVPALVLGHSWGAWLVFLLASRHPEVVSRAFLVAPGVWETAYLPELERRRLAALTPSEQAEYRALVVALEKSGENAAGQLRRLGELATRADDFEVSATPENREEMLPLSGTQYRALWAEAAQMRARGELVALAPHITVPLCLIHGLNDATPAAGVVEPLQGRVPHLSVHLLERCGHHPWKETHAQAEFFHLLGSGL